MPFVIYNDTNTHFDEANLIWSSFYIFFRTKAIIIPLRLIARQLNKGEMLSLDYEA